MTTYYAVKHEGEIVTLASAYGQQPCIFGERYDAEVCAEDWHKVLGLDPDEYPLEIEEVQL